MKRLAMVLVTITLLSAGETSMAIEEPDFEVIRTTDQYEIRQYAPFILAEVDVEAGGGDAGNRAFRILANYIFGNNESGTKMEMTAPVVSEAPREGRRNYTYSFVMESRYSLDTLPRPLDPRIRIVQKPAQVVAAREYSGRWTEESYLQHELSLITALTIDGLDIRDEPRLARYDSPFKPWFLRRNEVLVELDWK